MRTVVSPAANVRAFAELAALLARYRALTLEMAKRELVDQYAGQVLGFVWAIAHPLFLIALYVFVFAVV